MKNVSYSLSRLSGVVMACLLATTTLAACVGVSSSTTTTTDETGIQKIQHVVVIMQENRSLDSHFGTAFQLLVYAIIWRVTSNLSQQAGVKILLLCVAALGMGIQGALVMSFEIPGVVADALTATLITLGQRLAQDLGHPGPESQEWRRTPL
jgi:phospholipase C